MSKRPKNALRSKLHLINSADCLFLMFRKNQTSQVENRSRRRSLIAEHKMILTSTWSKERIWVNVFGDIKEFGVRSS